MSTLTVRAQHLLARAKKEDVFFFYSLSTLTLQSSVMLSAFIVLRFVSPEELGIWRTLLLFQTYGNVVTLGIPNGLSRELPFYLGRGDQEQAQRLAAVAQFYVLLIGGLGCIVLFAVAVFTPDISAEWMSALLALGMLWFTHMYRSYLGVTFRAEAEFRRLTVCNIIEFALTLGSLFLVVVGGYNGMIARYVLISVVMATLLHRIRPIHVRPHFVRPDFLMLLGTGIPQYFGGYLIMTSLAFEQTILAHHGGVEVIGLYAPVAAMTTVMQAIHGAIVSYINPRIVFRLGQRNDPNMVYRGVKIASIAISVISLPVVIGGIVVLPLVMPSLFPEYEVALGAIQMALAGGFFLAINTTLSGVYALKAWGYVAVYAVLAVVLRWILPWLLVQSGGDVLTRVALGGAIANVLVFAIGMAIMWKATLCARNDDAVAESTQDRF